MGILDGPLRNVASQLMKQFGTPGTITFRTIGAVNPATGRTTITETTQSVKGSVEQMTASETNGVKAGDVLYTIAALGLTREPGTQDRVTIGSTTYQIVKCNPTYSGDEVATYALHLRV